MRPATHKRCKFCRYCFSDAHSELQCLFLVEMAIFHKITPHIDCPLVKEK